MTTTNVPTAPSALRRRAVRFGVVCTAATAIITAAASPALADASRATLVPAAGSTVTCQLTGALTGTSGYLAQRETISVGHDGRARALFTIAADRVRLVAPDGSGYRLVGFGFDSVLYPSANPTGAVVREDEGFHFAVIGRTGVAGVVDFELHTGPDQIPHITDSSTCQLPNMS